MRPQSQGAELAVLLLIALQSRVCADIDSLLPAASLRAEPPSQVGRASCVLAGLALVLGMVPLCSYPGAQRLQGVALASSMPSTEWTACLAAGSPLVRWCRPAVLLACWTIVAEPEDLLLALQAYFVRKVPTLCVARVIPLCQEGSHFRILALCKGWVLGLFAAFCIGFCTLWAASFFFADPLTRWCTPLVAANITEPTNRLTALGHHGVRSTVVGFTVPLSCDQGSLGRQGIVLAHLAAAALRAASAIAPAGNSCLPAVQVAIWTLITYPPDFPANLWCDVNGTQVSIGSMVPLLLKS